MEKLVKEKSTNKFIGLTQAQLDANPELYIDFSDKPIYWLNHHEEAGYTYWQAKYHVKELVAAAGGFDTFRDAEKDAIGVFSFGDMGALIAFYATYYSYTLEQAQGFHVLRMSESVARSAADAQDIIRSPKIMQIGIKYLTYVDGTTGALISTQANNLTYAIQSFLTEYERYGILGLEYGDEREGLMDYIESTNSYAGSGLQNYEFNPDQIAQAGSEEAARLAMIEEIKDVFVKGNK